MCFVIDSQLYNQPLLFFHPLHPIFSHTLWFLVTSYDNTWFLQLPILLLLCTCDQCFLTLIKNLNLRRYLLSIFCLLLYTNWGMVEYILHKQKPFIAISFISFFGFFYNEKLKYNILILSHKIINRNNFLNSRLRGYSKNFLFF